MKLIVPIENLEIERVSKIEDCYFLPRRFLNELHLHQEEATISDYELQSIVDSLEIAGGIYMSKYSRYVVALFNCEFSQEQYDNNIPVNDFLYTEMVSYKVDRYLDSLRLKKCHFGNKKELPGIGGIIENYQQAIVLNVKKCEARELLGNVYGHVVIPGIGLYEVDISLNAGDIEYDFFNSKRVDEIYMTCRNALKRLNEAYYFNNYNTTFVYLMSTLEMLAFNDFKRFEKVKKIILSITSRSREEFEEDSEYLLKLSKNIRTEIVHNGRSIYDYFCSHDQVVNMLNKLQSLIVLFCFRCYDESIIPYVELHRKAKEKRCELGVAY